MPGTKSQQLSLHITKCSHLLQAEVRPRLSFPHDQRKLEHRKDSTGLQEASFPVLVTKPGVSIAERRGKVHSAPF